MKKLLSVMLSLVMVMALFTGCGDKEAKDSTFFKEVTKMQDIQTGTSEMEFAVDVKGKEVTESTDIPEQLKNGDSVALKIKMEATTESTTKECVKLSAQYGSNDYMELTTIVLDGSKLYLNVGSIVDFIKTVDESLTAQLEAGLGQLGISKYVSIDLKQISEAAGTEIPDMSKSVSSIQDLTKKLLDNLDESFTEIQGKDGDDYTLTVGADNAEKVADALIKFCEEDSLKQTYTDIMDIYAEMFGADSEMGKQFAEMKNDTTSIDEAVKQLKDNKENIVKGLKDSKINAVAKFNITGDAGSRVGKLSIDSGEFKDEKSETTGRITLTSNVKEGKVSIKDMVPTEGVVDLTAMINAMMSSATGAGAAESGNTALY